MEAAPGLRLLGVRHVARGSLLRLEHRHYLAPGHTRVIREVVRHPGSVAVVPRSGSQVFLIRQHRTPIERSVLEIPAGLRDHPGEEPAATAARELEEEIGRRAGRLELVSRFHLSPGFTDEEVWLYVADDLEEVSMRPHGVEEEAAEVVRMELAEARSMAARGEITDAKTLIGLTALGEGRA